MNLCMKSKSWGAVCKLEANVELQDSGFHYALKTFSHVSVDFKVMKVSTYPFAMDRCSFCKQLLQLKSLSPSICPSSSAVMGEGSQEQFVISFTLSQPAKFLYQKTNLIILFDFVWTTHKSVYATKGIEE